MPSRRIAAWTLILLIACAGYLLYRVDYYSSNTPNLWLVVKNHAAIATIDREQAKLTSAIERCKAENLEAETRQSHAGIELGSPLYRWPACNDQMASWEQSQDKNERKLYLLKFGTDKPPDKDVDCCALPPEDQEKREELDQDKRELMELSAEVRQCQSQIQAAQNEQAERIFHLPKCAPKMRQWMARCAQLEAEIQGLQFEDLPSNQDTDGWQSSKLPNESGTESQPR
jgi:hypothetical protein